MRLERGLAPSTFIPFPHYYYSSFIRSPHTFFLFNNYYSYPSPLCRYLCPQSAHQENIPCSLESNRETWVKPFLRLLSLLIPTIPTSPRFQVAQHAGLSVCGARNSESHLTTFRLDIASLIQRPLAPFIFQ